jgi:hypothetical protein
MTVNKLTDSINKTVLSGLILIFTLISTGTIYAKNLTTSTEQKGIVGVWQLNQTATYKTNKKTKIFPMPVPIAFAPESLILAADEGVNEITINEGFKEFIHTQTLPTDGTTVVKNVQPIGQISAKAFWKDKKLIVEVTTSRGDKMTEIFEVTSNQKRLSVTLEINDGVTAKTMKVRRIYNRMADQVEDSTAEIGISQYAF